MTKRYAYVQLLISGSYRYYYTLESDPEHRVVGSGFFVVDPCLVVGSDMRQIDLNAIQCQTVLSKALGPIDRWKERLVVAAKTGFNMIHFTPIQELGASNSAYSLKNHFRLNPAFNCQQSGAAPSFQDVRHLVEFMNKEWQILSITDIVLNHTANETDWLQEHPEAGYNLINSPHLRPAFLFDRLLFHLSLDLEAGKWDGIGLTQVSSEQHLSLLRDTITQQYLPAVRLHEFYLFNIERTIAELREALTSSCHSTATAGKNEASGVRGEEKYEIIVKQDPLFRRFGSAVQLESVLEPLIQKACSRDQATCENWIESSIAEARVELEAKAESIVTQVNDHVLSGVENVIRAVRYERLQSQEKEEKITRQSPLVTEYFTYSGPEGDLAQVESVMDDECAAAHFCAHNGWVMNFDPLRNFAAADCNVYLRRELIAWGDSVKLRYGDCPADSPFLWETMKSYVQQTAEIFDGIRLDNCHSTPIPVACFMLDAARRVRPDLYVIAELFTTSEHADNVFVNHLGINSLIRESMSCHDSHELGRLVHRFGGKPVGSFAKTCFRPLTNSVSHAIFFDVTHDNESPVVKKTAYDLLPTSALLALSDNATGSTRGYDELVPHHIHVVRESRFYASWNDGEEERRLEDPTHINYSNGLVKVRKILNDLHHRLSQEGFSEIFVDQVDSNVVAVTRHNPTSHRSVVLAARTCFYPQDPLVTGFIRNIEIAGRINQILLEARMTGKMTDKFVPHPEVINGVPASDFRTEIKQNLPAEKSSLVTVTAGDINHIRFTKFIPSSVVAFDVSLSEVHEKAVQRLKQHLEGISSSLKPVVDKIDLMSLNHILFKCEQEEKDDISTGGTYSIPGFADFVYAGLCGLMFYWKTIRTSDDMGHPICQNLRAGNWLPDYISQRLLRCESTRELGEWMKEGFQTLDCLPKNLVPRYFDGIITAVYSRLISRLLQQQSEFVRKGSKFVQLLAVGAVALVGYNQSSPLPPLSDNLSTRPPVREADGIRFPITATISAGLPHFSSGYMRNWGRDTFISLRGLLLVTGRFDEARNIILGFAAALRHGLIPNLLDRGVKARYNCRDAVWFWLQTIKEYCSIAPNGTSILCEPVCRLFINDDDEARVRSATEQPLHQVMQEVLLRHFRGIDFKERNWGVQIDAHMREAGFHVTVGVNRETGLLFGGNKFNCGTWMDKMGSSSKAGNRGIPSSPRDGSAVELIGLQYSVVLWLHQINDVSVWPYEGVTDDGTFWSWSDWSHKIANNFERCFWVDAGSQHPLTNRCNIYKDTCGASDEWQDFQLRPNFVIAMAVAPQLFHAPHARLALAVVEQSLLGPLGMRTLDPGYVSMCVSAFLTISSFPIVIGTTGGITTTVMTLKIIRLLTDTITTRDL